MFSSFQDLPPSNKPPPAKSFLTNKPGGGLIESFRYCCHWLESDFRVKYSAKGKVQRAQIASVGASCYEEAIRMMGFKGQDSLENVFGAISLKP